MRWRCGLFGTGLCGVLNISLILIQCYAPFGKVKHGADRGTRLSLFGFKALQFRLLAVIIDVPRPLG